MKQLFPIREWILYLFGLLIVWNLYHPLPSFYIEAHFSFIPVTFLFGHLLSIFLMVMEVLILMYFINEYESMRLLILVRSRNCVFIGRILVRMMWPSVFFMFCIALKTRGASLFLDATFENRSNSINFAHSFKQIC